MLRVRVTFPGVATQNISLLINTCSIFTEHYSTCHSFILPNLLYYTRLGLAIGHLSCSIAFMRQIDNKLIPIMIDLKRYFKAPNQQKNQFAVAALLVWADQLDNKDNTLLYLRKIV